ncbi:DDE-type integrase/transposase/recombinase [Allorhizocola rhizosphaerae]|uniref:DDE-type integrase/transposase/recombinase n=1 Tax=Allorhizocola rhizosphaerae TaxID=1872709 RepID=UPI001B8BA4F8
MQRAGLVGLPGSQRRRPLHGTPFAGGLVDRKFDRQAPDQLWVTDITEHPTREGKVYCCVVLDTFSRKVVGWSIDSSQTASLVTNALGMAVHNRQPSGGGDPLRSRGAIYTSWAISHLIQQVEGASPKIVDTGCYAARASVVDRCS